MKTEDRVQAHVQVPEKGEVVNSEERPSVELWKKQHGARRLEPQQARREGIEKAQALPAARVRRVAAAPVLDCLWNHRPCRASGTPQRRVAPRAGGTIRLCDVKRRPT
ncbi:hypothetical protein NDU88_006914 [Pleurodeles waltl]|uniref:Uncharacterized protein n=1 Tax=Pleurodeles waltl TaxID=8319 RepID=A0AAV7SQZ7_PLEWA|nr:hypothetical protein NDU88_006914 [Pleurodeles waltl]